MYLSRHRRLAEPTTGTIARCTCGTRTSCFCPHHNPDWYAILDAKHRGERTEAAA